MIGLGYLMQSVVITLLALSVLLGVDKAENRIKRYVAVFIKKFSSAKPPLA